MAPPARLERTTFRLGGGPSILVRYGGILRRRDVCPAQAMIFYSIGPGLSIQERAFFAPAARRVALHVHQDDVPTQARDLPPGDDVVVLAAEEAAGAAGAGDYERAEPPGAGVKLRVADIAEAHAAFEVYDLLAAYFREQHAHFITPGRIYASGRKDMP